MQVVPDVRQAHRLDACHLFHALGESEQGVSKWEAARLALAVGLSLLTLIILAASIGALIPLALNRVNIDPAIATGPFITTTNDIAAIMIYLGMASLLLG